MNDLSEDELTELFELADMNLAAYADLLDRLTMEQPQCSRQMWLGTLAKVTAGFNADGLRVLLSVAVLRIRGLDKAT